MDRAGYVGDDGAVHHGFCDQAFLRPMPGIVLMAPSDERELGRALRLGLSLDHASAVRYPRDVVPACNFEDLVTPELKSQAAAEWVVGRSRTIRTGHDATLIVYGALLESSLAAAEKLTAEGINVEVIDARFCKPVDGDMLARVLAGKINAAGDVSDGFVRRPVLTIEDHSLQNGFGTAVLEYAVSHGLPTDAITRLGMPDRLIAHATRAQQLEEVGLDMAGILRSTREAVAKFSAATVLD
jgi:1-deoxy-D-xylulose-5-phosphate synthase